LHGECAVRDMSDPAMSMLGLNGVAGAGCLLPTNREKWMKLVKTSAVAVAISALLAGPILAQGASSGTQVRGGAQGKTQMQGGASGSMDEDAAPPAGAASQRAGAKAGIKGTVGAGSGAKATGTATTPPATGR
jgi:hypothetical protein